MITLLMGKEKDEMKLGIEINVKTINDKKGMLCCCMPCCTTYQFHFPDG